MISEITSILSVIPIIRNFISSLSYEIEAFEYTDFDSDADSSVFIITPYPRRYYLRLLISNGSQIHIGIKRIVLEIGDRILDPSDRIMESFEPGESRLLDIIFPIDTEMTDNRYTIIVTDSRGRKTRLKGAIK